MPMQKITQAFVDGLQPHAATTWYRDTDLSGFVLAVGKETITFYAEGEHRRKFRRVKIGRADITAANVARRIARDELLPAIRQGIDPRPAKPEPVALVIKGETFEETWKQYRHYGAKAQSQTLADYDRILRTKVPLWLERETASITSDEVLTTWRKETRGSMASAKSLMRVVSAVMHDAKKRKIVREVQTTDSLPRGWSSIVRNPQRIKDLAVWWEKVDGLDNMPAVKTVLRVLLLTGLRVGDVLSLRLQDVFLDEGKLHIRKPKSGGARDVALPTQAVALIKRYMTMQEITKGMWLFPSFSSRGHLITLPAGSGHPVPDTAKSTRNEFISVATEIGMQEKLIAYQVGHATGSMTSSYVVTPDVREAVQKVADEIYRRAKPVKPS